MENREDKMVVIKRDADGNAVIWCDPEIVDLVTALNEGGLRTSASCSGHGYRPGRIMLADGRELFVARDQQDVECIEAAFPLDINGHSKAERDAWAAASDGGADTVTPTLKPCPFCGGAARQPKLNDEWGVYALNCSQCHGGTGGDTADEAVDEWNTRAAEAAQAAEIARLRELVASLYCASGCSCCRDHEAWEKASNELGELLNIPKYVDGSGYDFYSVRDAALSAQPSEQDDDDIPERIGKCENCEAIIRDGDKFVSYDDGVVICDACPSSEQEGGE